MTIRLLGICLLWTLAATSVSASPGDEVPSWLHQATTIQLPAYDKDVPAVVLVDDGTINIDPDGRVNKIYNFAIRILRREGREYAVGHVGYIPDIGKVKELHAWLIHANGEVKKYGKDDVVDLAGAPNDVYNEYRLKQVSASSE